MEIRFNPQERGLGTHWMERWGDVKENLNEMTKRKIFVPERNRT
jgi:hypothetical protein